MLKTKDTGREQRALLDNELRTEIESLIEQRETKKETIDKLLRERQAIIERSTAYNLDRIDAELRCQQASLTDTQQALARCELKVPTSAREAELKRQIVATFSEEQAVRFEFSLANGGGVEGGALPYEFICSDAVARLDSELREAEEEAAKVERHFRQFSSTRAVGASLEPQKKLEHLKSAYPRRLKAAETGQKLFEIASRRKLLIEERDRLEAERRNLVYGK